MLTPLLQWLMMPNNLIFLCFHFAISKRTSLLLPQTVRLTITCSLRKFAAGYVRTAMLMSYLHSQRPICSLNSRRALQVKSQGSTDKALDYPLPVLRHSTRLQATTVRDLRLSMPLRPDGRVSASEWYPVDCHQRK